MTDRDELGDVLDHLASLAPDATETPRQASHALAQLGRRVAPPDQRGGRIRSERIMTTRRIATLGLTLVVAVAVLMAFPSVRAAANDFLGLFRVQKFAPISVSMEQLSKLEQLGEDGLMPGEFVTVKDPGELQPVDSLESAEAQTGYSLRVLRDRDLPSEIYISGDASGYMIINLAGARAIAEAAGADPQLLPDSLDGGRVDVSVYKGVQQLYSDGVALIQSPVPDVTYPQGIDATALGELVLQVLGNDPATAHNMAQRIDWTSTMLLPVPVGLGTYRERMVDGVMGVVLEPFDPESDPSIVWQKGGMLYMLTGPVGVRELISLANSLR